MFIDKSWIIATSGRGGDGVVAWSRTSSNSKGGPAGGNGGKGGSIFIQGTSNYQDLSHIQYKHRYKAKSGTNGGGNRKKGKNGEDIVILVPFGTEIRNSQTKELILDLDVSIKHPVLLCKGGNGGLGNSEFATSIMQVPDHITKGAPAQELRVNLELKSIADVGFVGAPSAGKSSLLNAIGSMSVKTGAYPFTTLSPNLCVLREKKGDKGVVVADVPGLIEGAHLNKGLGIGFLRHVERCSSIIIVIDGAVSTLEAIDNEARMIISEIEKYNDRVASRVSMVVINKLDIMSDEIINGISSIMIYKDYKVLLTSALVGNGIKELRKEIEGNSKKSV